MSEYVIKPLDLDTWSAFARLLDKHKGAGFGAGCWCTWFHPRAETDSETETGRACKERLVREGKARAALVFDGDVAVAWCQFGSPAELPWQSRPSRVLVLPSQQNSEWAHRAGSASDQVVIIADSNRPPNT